MDSQFAPKNLARDVVRSDSLRPIKTARADSESRILANKIFSTVWTFRRFAVSQTRFFCQLPALIRARDFSGSSPSRPSTTPVRTPNDDEHFHPRPSSRQLADPALRFAGDAR
jgi:hypothetical protein